MLASWRMLPHSPHSISLSWCSSCVLSKPFQTSKMLTTSGCCDMWCNKWISWTWVHFHTCFFIKWALWSNAMLCGISCWWIKRSKSLVNGARNINPHMNVCLFLWEQITNLSKMKSSIVVNLSSMVSWSPQECCHVGSWGQSISGRLDIRQWQQLDQPWELVIHGGTPMCSLHVCHLNHFSREPSIPAIGWPVAEAGKYQSAWWFHLLGCLWLFPRRMFSGVYNIN